MLPALAHVHTRTQPSSLHLCVHSNSLSHTHTHTCWRRRGRKRRRGDNGGSRGALTHPVSRKKKKKNEKRGATVTPLLQGKDFYRDEEPCSAALRWQMFNACSCRSCTLSVDVELQWINWSEWMVSCYWLLLIRKLHTGVFNSCTACTARQLVWELFDYLKVLWHGKWVLESLLLKN